MWCCMLWLCYVYGGRCVWGANSKCCNFFSTIDMGVFFSYKFSIFNALSNSKSYLSRQKKLEFFQKLSKFLHVFACQVLISCNAFACSHGNKGTRAFVTVNLLSFNPKLAQNITLNTWNRHDKRGGDVIIHWTCTGPS